RMTWAPCLTSSVCPTTFASPGRGWADEGEDPVSGALARVQVHGRKRGPAAAALAVLRVVVEAGHVVGGRHPRPVPAGGGIHQGQLHQGLPTAIAGDAKLRLAPAGHISLD